jgi:hypothetical protein
MQKSRETYLFLLELAQKYLCLPDKSLIEEPFEFLYVGTIPASRISIHPFRGYEIVISRRALKHFVDKRRAEMEKRHSHQEILEAVLFALRKIQEVIILHDSYEYIPPRHYFTKAFPYLNKALIRIITDQKKDRLEICSIHFKTNRANKQ